MAIDQVVSSKMNGFLRNYNLTNLSEGRAFEMFVNREVLATHQPNAFDASHELLDHVCVGGGQDGGMDGICIKIDGVLISTPEEIDDLFELNKKVDVEFIFVQSKCQDSFSATEYQKFIAGVRDFMSESHHLLFNDQVKYWLELKGKVYDNIDKWKKGSPVIRLYYVSMGRWYNDANIVAISNQFKDDMNSSATYGEINIHYFDKKSFLNICDENENAFSITIPYIEIRKLESTVDVDDFVMCSFAANEFLQLLTSEEGILRKNMFDDNVRDYQGGTSVNNEILKTIKDSPELLPYTITE